MMGRVNSFQYIRVLAFLLIFISHCSFLTVRTNMWGAFGVSIFIMLSGFLRYYNGNAESFRNSILVRLKNVIKRIVFLHIFTFAVAVPVYIGALQNSGEYNLIRLLFIGAANLLMIHSFVPVPGVYFSYNAVSWYLTLVVIFACVGCEMAKLVKGITTRITGRYVIAGIWCFQVIFSFIAAKYEIAHWLVYINPIFRVTDYTVGMLLADECMKIKDRSSFWHKWKWTMILPFFLMIISLYLQNDLERVLFYTAAWIPGTIVLISLFFALDSKKMLINRLCNDLGELGLELFMVHQLVVIYITILIPSNGVSLVSILKVVVSLIITVFISKILNYINRNWKKFVRF